MEHQLHSISSIISECEQPCLNFIIRSKICDIITKRFNSHYRDCFETFLILKGSMNKLLLLFES